MHILVLPKSTFVVLLWLSYTTELFAAREKNGIYIPRDMYSIEEAEKKVSSEVS